MARVVQRRNNPPYLLFIFVFAFLVAATLAMIGFMKADEIEQNIVKLEKDNQELTTARKELVDENAQLAQLITGSSESPTEAIEAARNAKATTDMHSGLAADLITLNQRVESLQSEIESLKTRLANKDNEIADVRQKLTELNTEHETTLTELEAEKTALVSQLSSAQADYKKRMDQHLEELDKTRKDLQAQLEDKDNQIEKLVTTIQNREEQITELRNSVQDLKALLTPGGTDVVNQPDGKIVKITRGTDYCYIDLGSEQKVRQGMNFAVYSQDAEFKDDAKGKVRVIKVEDNISECKIIEENEDSPITQGDGVANLAFSTGRTYNFVVQGRFDVYGGGQPSDLGRQAIKDAIQRFGGSLSDEISVQTDYVVLGVEPTKPTTPAADAPATVQTAYQDQMKQYQDYIDTLSLAQSMKIPVLNGTRFMALTGYMPEKRPE